MSVVPQPWPQPAPQLAEAVAAMYRGKRERPLPVLVLVRDKLGEWLADDQFAGADSAGPRPRRTGRRALAPRRERNRESFQAAHQMSDEAKRRLIRPVQVVDRQEYGRSLRDADCQPIQAVQHGERVFLGLVLARC